MTNLRTQAQEKLENLLNNSIFHADAILTATFQVLNKIGLTEES
jgi:hypothetical protein